MSGVGNPTWWQVKCAWCGEPVEFDNCVSLMVMVPAPHRKLGVERRWLDGGPNSYHDGVCSTERLKLARSLEPKGS